MSLHVRLATPADLDRLAPLFDAYRQFYTLPADLALSRAYLGERMRKAESLLLVADAGAYGRCMSSEYNLRALPAEDVIDE